MKIMVIDLETGGLKTEKDNGISEIAAVTGEIQRRIQGQKDWLAFEVEETFHRYVKPQDHWTYTLPALRVQGNNLETLQADGVPLPMVLGQLNEFIDKADFNGTGRSVWGQNAGFDYDFLYKNTLHFRPFNSTYPNMKSFHHVIEGDRCTWNCTRYLGRLLRTLGFNNCSSDSLKPSFDFYYPESSPGLAYVNKSTQDCIMTGHMVAKYLDIMRQMNGDTIPR